jgi:hypothetical protein
MISRGRVIWLVIDALALLGVVVFSVLSALEPDEPGYVIGQIVSAGLILVSVILWRRSRRPPPGGLA